jgi:hypothetical protein
VGHGDLTAGQRDQTPPLPAVTADLADCLAEAIQIEITVSKNEIGWQNSALVHDIRRGDITAVKERFGPRARKGRDGHLCPPGLVVRVGQDPNQHRKGPWSRLKFAAILP